LVRERWLNLLKALRCGLVRLPKFNSVVVNVMAAKRLGMAAALAAMTSEFPTVDAIVDDCHKDPWGSRRPTSFKLSAKDVGGRARGDEVDQTAAPEMVIISCRKIVAGV
jgi:hypothetical protein